MSFLRKQQSRLVPAQAGIQETGSSPFWIPAFVGMTPLSQLRSGAILSRRGRGELLHSAKVLQKKEDVLFQ